MLKLRIFAVLLFASFCFAQHISTSNKSVSVRVNGLPPQYTALRIDTLSRCIVNLPDPDKVTATADGRTEYLKRIEGTDKNDYVKVWNGRVQLVYQWKYQLQYLLMPQGGLEAQAPIFNVTEGTSPVSETIVGDPQDGDFFAFSSPRRYYFNTQEAALASAVNRTKQRIAELKGLECPK